MKNIKSILDCYGMILHEAVDGFDANEYEDLASYGYPAKKEFRKLQRDFAKLLLLLYEGDDSDLSEYADSLASDYWDTWEEVKEIAEDDLQ